MAQQTIGIGAAPNDGTGDKPRPGFTKVNDNFTELYNGLRLPAYQSGMWYPCYPQANGNVSSAGAGNGLIKYTPVIITRPVTISGLMVRASAYSAGNVQMAIYASDANGRPTGAPLAYTANLTPGGPGLVSGLFTAGSGSNITLQPGMYFAAVWQNQNSTQYMSSNNHDNSNAYYMGSATDTTVSASSSLSTFWLQTTLAYSALGWPTNPSVTEGASAAWAFFWFKVA